MALFAGIYATEYKFEVTRESLISGIIWQITAKIGNTAEVNSLKDFAEVDINERRISKSLFGTYRLYNRHSGREDRLMLMK